MCGIFATLKTVEDRQTIIDLLSGLKKLEYRGYDSWGIAYVKKGQLRSYKQLGNLDNQAVLASQNISSQMGIAHTRWATHGSVCLKNTHPHLDKKQRFAVVHNGVIENYQQLKTKIQKQGYSLQSETDSELIVALLSLKLDNRNKTLKIELLKNIQKQLLGRNTFVILEKTGNIFVSKNGLSLFLAKDQHNNVYLSSDLTSLPQSCKYFYRFLDEELMSIKQGIIRLIEKKGIEKVIKWQDLKIEKTQVKEEMYESAMLNEIYEQKFQFESLWKKIDSKKLTKIRKILTKNKKIFFIGAGSAFYVANYLSYLFRQNKYFATSISSGEIDGYLNLIDNNSLIIAISQSGETADTIEAIEKCQKRRAFCLSILNSPQSTLAHLSNDFFDLDIGKEIAVASTKAVTAQLAWGNFIINKTNQMKNQVLLKEKIKKEQKVFAEYVDYCFQKTQALTKMLINEKNCFVLGQNKLLPLANEFALKLKEIAYLHAEALANSELKHGALALIQKNTVIFALITNTKNENAACLNSLAEAKSRGAKIIAISKEDNAIFDQTIIVPKLNLLEDLVYIIPAQLLSYHLAIKRGNNPDRPRNLAKSVTVK